MIIKSNMTDRISIIDPRFLARKLIGVWELISDSSQMAIEGYALSFEGYFLEIETMLDISAIEIACGHCRSDFPMEVRPDCLCNEVSNHRPFSHFLGKRLSKWRLLIGENGNWEGLLLSFGTFTGLCFVSVNSSISPLALDGVQC